MIRTKRVINSTPDGTTELFQLPEEFIPNSIWVFEVATDSTVKIRTTEEIGAQFIKITPAPESGSNLYVSYDIIESDNINEAGLSNWDKDSISRILQTVVEQQKTIVAIDKAMEKRVTLKDFDSWASVVERKLKDFETRLITQ